MTQSYENFDKPYRRGLVLGLSLAEVFLILLFLLLLAAIGLTSSLQEELTETEIQRQELEDSLVAFRDVIGNKITLEDFTRLQKNAAAQQKLERENITLRDELAEAKNELEEISDVVKALQDNNIKPSDLAEIIEGNETLAAALAEKSSIEKKLEETQSDMKKLEKELIAQQIKTELAKSELKEAQKEVDKKENELTQMAQDYENEKGRNPPCWFRLVADKKSGSDRKRSRDVKIFDIKIEDDGFLIIKHDNQNISEPIDFGNEAGLPTYPAKLFKSKLRSREFKDGFKSYFIAGETNKIRAYPCVFTVDVYDGTSKTNKSGYKSKLRDVEGLFAIYKVKDGKWPLK